MMSDPPTRRRAAAARHDSLNGSAGSAAFALGSSTTSLPSASDLTTYPSRSSLSGIQLGGLPSSADRDLSSSADGLPLYRHSGGGDRRRRSERRRRQRRKDDRARMVVRAILVSFAMIACALVGMLFRISTAVDGRGPSPSVGNQPPVPADRTETQTDENVDTDTLDGVVDNRVESAGKEVLQDSVPGDSDKLDSDARELERRKTKQPNAGFQKRLDGAPPCTKLDPDDISYTLVTQLSSDRIWMMQQHCQRWGGETPISVVVYTDESSAQLTDDLVSLGCNRKQLTVQTLSTSAYSQNEYPVNVMRNMAIRAVKTTHVFYADVDFWESTNLLEVLNMPSVRKELAEDHKLATVVPAFMVMRQCAEYRDCREENLAKMPNTTKQMIDLVMDHKAGAFDPTNRGGHGSTSYAAWYKQNEGELYDVPCFKSNRYEPYLAFRYCEDLPPFQEQFTGYGKNKMTWVMQLRRQGYDFSQLGQIFLVHYPHLDSKARLEWNEGPKEIFEDVEEEGGTKRRKKPGEVEDVDWNTFVRGRMDHLYLDFREWLNQEIPDEARVKLCEDANDDDKMLWVNKES